MMIAQTAADSQTPSPVPPWLVETLKLIFSWAILMPIAVIVSGKLLAQRFNLRTRTKQLFRIPVIGVFDVQANDDEVILGFSGFITTLFLVSILAGKAVYHLFRVQFGIDPGHFNCLCIFSSFATVVWTLAVFIFGGGGRGPLAPVRDEHAELIEQLSTRPPPP
jgi:hypothetical protein